MSSFKFKFDTKELENNLDKLSREADEWWREARGQMAESLLNLSQKQVPIDQTTLLKSGIARYEEKTDAWMVRYGGGNAKKYAIYIHEGVRKDGSRAIVNYKEPGRKSKFLFDPLVQNISLWNKQGVTFVKNKLQGKL